MNIWAVGGCVRNMVWGRASSDEDGMIMQHCRERFEARHPEARMVGRDFPVYLLDRAQIAVCRGQTLEEDLARRDFTINACALSVEGDFCCHPRALQDLARRVLRPASGRCFHDDPVRIFRAARFCAEFPELRPSNTLFSAMRRAQDAGLLLAAVPERVARETMRALSGAEPGRFIQILAKGGCLRPWLAEIADALEREGARALLRRAGNLAKTMNRLSGQGERVWMGVCAFCLGEGADPNERGAKAVTLARRAGLPERFVQAGRDAAMLFTPGCAFAEMDASRRVDFLERLAERDLFDALGAVVTAMTGDDPTSDWEREWAVLEQVRLAENERGLGPESGRSLRQRRTAALSGARKGEKTI